MGKRKFVIIIIITIILFLIVNIATASVIEYYFAKSTYRIPVLVIKSDSVAKQYTKYTGLFYKVYKCYSDYVVVTGAKEEEPYCSRVIRYSMDGYYTNYNGIKIEKKDFQLIFDKSVTFSEIDKFKTYKEVENAILVADEYQRNLYVTGQTKTINNELVSIVVSPEYVEVNQYGDYDWRYQTDNPKYYKCMKNSLFKKYDNDNCVGEWKKLTYSKEFCELAKINSISSIQEAYKNNCE